MTTFGNHKSLTFYLSVITICLFSANISLTYLSYQVNDKILKDGQEKYFHKLEKKVEQDRLVKEHQAKKKIYNILSQYRTGLNSHKLRQTARVIHQEGKKYGYDPMLLVAIIKTESTFNNWAVSNVGARGLMQLMPVTAREIANETKLNWEGKRMLYDPLVNVKMGSYYLDKMDKKFGNLQLALEAYNNGPRRLYKYLNKGYLPTRYSNKVFGFYEKLKKGRI